MTPRWRNSSMTCATSQHGGLAVEHSSDCIRETVGVHVLQQVAGGASAKGVEEIVVVPRDRQHDHRRLGKTSM